MRAVPESLEHVILAFPSLIQLSGVVSGEPARSWNQVAMTGSFVSNRYGKFSITKEDLSQMLRNFNEVTPKAPTELPIDYDHLSMDPKKPMDGKAAGWFKRLELREDGSQLWADIEWTPPAAKAIENKEYRFVSPSFVKDHKHKDGKKIGTTLLAAAITNHPFLEGMQALTLYNFSAMGDLAMITADMKPLKEVVNLAEVGQRVMIAPGEAHVADEVSGTFEIAEVVGDGDDAFVAVKDANGVVHKWFRATELVAASAIPPNPVAPNLPPTPGAPGVPAVPAAPAAADPVAAAVAAAVDPTSGDTPAVPMPAPGERTVVPPSDKVADADKKQDPDPDKETDPDKTEGAAGADAMKKASGDVKEKAVESDSPELDQDELMAAIRKMIAAALAGAGQTPVAQPKGIAHMATMFTLRNDRNEVIELSAEKLLEQLTAAGVKTVPEGQVVIPATELTELKGQVTSLSTTVASMRTDQETTAKDGRLRELNATLDRLSQGAFISKVTRDALFDQFKDAIDLSGFRTIAGTFTTPILSLGKVHGTGADAPGEKSAGETSTDKIISLANQYVKDRGLSYRDAMILAGKDLAEDAEKYRDQFAATA